MWPTCFYELKPFNRSLKDELPQFLVDTFYRNEIKDLKEMLVPIRVVTLLGKCSMDKYIDCPNFPEWHLQNSGASMGSLIDYQYLAEIGRYYWFEFDLMGSTQNPMPFRIVFDEGDADCKDGIWRACWDRNTGEIVANLKSVGDCVTEIEMVSKKPIQAYKPHNAWILVFAEKEEEDSLPDNLLPVDMLYAANLELEKYIGLAIRWCWFLDLSK
ncbi:MAG: hypothetical protein F6K42_13765 [Leptolyngbya sp. SIO1D8]|nr:hypothetical protein [Leptolyngbya sp. SIO1D8]